MNLIATLAASTITPVTKTVTTYSRVKTGTKQITTTPATTDIAVAQAAVLIKLVSAAIGGTQTADLLGIKADSAARDNAAAAINGLAEAYADGAALSTAVDAAILLLSGKSVFRIVGPSVLDKVGLVARLLPADLDAMLSGSAAAKTRVEAAIQAQQAKDAKKAEKKAAAEALAKAQAKVTKPVAAAPKSIAAMGWQTGIAGISPEVLAKAVEQALANRAAIMAA